MNAFILAGLGLAALAHGSASPPLPSRSIYHSQASWETQAGVAGRLLQLRGKPVVMAMVYTSCPGSCPLMMADLKAIEKALDPEARREVRFAVVSFDTARDTPATLRAFAAKHAVDLERWTFFRGPTTSVRELAALLGVRFKLLADGEVDHSNSVSILDADGVVVHKQVGLRQKPDASLERLRALIPPKAVAGP